MKKNTSPTGRLDEEFALPKLPPRNESLKDLYQQFVSQPEIMQLNTDYSALESRILQESGIDSAITDTKAMIEQFQARLNKTLMDARKKASNKTKSGRPTEKALEERRSKAKASKKARKGSR